MTLHSLDAGSVEQQLLHLGEGTGHQINYLSSFLGAEGEDSINQYHPFDAYIASLPMHQDSSECSCASTQCRACHTSSPDTGLSSGTIGELSDWFSLDLVDSVAGTALGQEGKGSVTVAFGLDQPSPMSVTAVVPAVIPPCLGPPPAPLPDFDILMSNGDVSSSFFPSISSTTAGSKSPKRKWDPPGAPGLGVPMTHEDPFLDGLTDLLF